MAATRNWPYRRRATLTGPLASFPCFILSVLLVAPSMAWAQSSEQQALREAARLNKEAVALYKAGKFSEAEPLLQRSLVIYEKALGPEHLEVAGSLIGLAVIYQQQGRIAEAEPLLRRSLAILEKTLGPEHPNTAVSLSFWAVNYMAQGRFAEAEPLLRRSLAILEKTLGPEHPNVAASLVSLAFLDYFQGRYAQAEPLFRRSLAILEKALGPEHPIMTMILGHLAELYRIQGEYSKGELIFQRYLAIIEKFLGPNHPVGVALKKVAELYRDQKVVVRLEPLYQLFLPGLEKLFGSNHLIVAGTLYNLAYILGEQQQFELARPLYERARKIRLTAARANADLGEEGQRGLWKAGFRWDLAYLKMLAGIAREPQINYKQASPAADAFLVAEEARSGMADAALVKSSSRVAADDPLTANLARLVQDLRNRRQTLIKDSAEKPPS